jgi:PHD/YefM family antitoxin component YafN of YafNO toxin-antitoxin module
MDRQEEIMVYVTANDLKKKGVSLLDEVIGEEEAIITVRGKGKYVVIAMDTYNQFRELELETALTQARRDIKAGQGIAESVDKHIKRISKR